MPDTCKHCGGKISARNPTGRCDHIYWPDNLTDEALRANGYIKVERQVIVDTGPHYFEFEAGVKSDGKW